MFPQLVVPPNVSPGDRIAVVSPSFAAPGAFAAIHEQARRRVRDELGLVPVEYPTTRRLGSSVLDRAADLHAAFADPSIRAVFATIGGDDQVTLTPHLDPAVFRADPKPFFGYSDNTNLLNWLWYHGIAAYHGGSTQVHLGRGGALHPVSLRSLRCALFTHEYVDVSPADEFAEDDIDWAQASALTTSASMRPGSRFHWHQPDRSVTARTSGGNVEALNWILTVPRHVRPVEDDAGCVLLLETSEEMPPAEQAFRILRNMGERGLLEQFPAVLFGRAKAANLLVSPSPAERQGFRESQRDAVLRAFGSYNPDAMIVFDVDFGHTDPQWVLPFRGDDDRRRSRAPARRALQVGPIRLSLARRPCRQPSIPSPASKAAPRGWRTRSLHAAGATASAATSGRSSGLRSAVAAAGSRISVGCVA